MWEREPVTAVELVKLCRINSDGKGLRLIPLSSVLESVVCWKTTMALLLLSFPKMMPRRVRSTNWLRRKFEGSLPAFIAAFTKHQAMSEDELDEMQRMIDRIRKGGSQWTNSFWKSSTWAYRQAGLSLLCWFSDLYWRKPLSGQCSALGYRSHQIDLPILFWERLEPDSECWNIS